MSGLWFSKRYCHDIKLNYFNVMHETSHRNFQESRYLYLGGNWEAESGHDNSDERYFINLCHELVNSQVTSKCPTDAAACFDGKCTR